MNNLTPLTKSEVSEFVAKWYQKLDLHAPLEDYRSLLAEQELEMQFPEGTFRDFEGFKSWYERVIGIFFDEVHTLKEIKLISVSSEQAEVSIIVNWQASVWNPPASKSERIILDAYQTWVMKRSPQTQKLVIQTYAVDSMVYAEGSARL
jgi:hypothetical protein